MYDFGDEEEDESDDDYGLKQAFYVEFPANFDPKKPPQTGDEYLHHVIYERSKLVRLPYKRVWTEEEKLACKSYKLPIPDTELDSDRKSPFVPTKDWQEAKVREFKGLREFLFYKQYIKRDSSYFRDDTFLEEISNGATPTFSKMMAYAVPPKKKMLEGLVSHVEEIEPGGSIDKSHGTWLYSLLLLLEVPLTPYIHSWLRNLSRKCIKLRSSLPPDAKEESYAPLNLFICIVGRYYGQFDLADPYET